MASESELAPKTVVTKPMEIGRRASAELDEENGVEGVDAGENQRSEGLRSSRHSQSKKKTLRRGVMNGGRAQKRKDGGMCHSQLILREEGEGEGEQGRVCRRVVVVGCNCEDRGDEVEGRESREGWGIGLGSCWFFSIFLLFLFFAFFLFCFFSPFFPSLFFVLFLSVFLLMLFFPCSIFQLKIER